MTAAYLLARDTDIHPLILEQEAFTGGIARTFNYHGNRMDIGGHRFFTKDKRVKQLWQDLLPLQGAPAYDDLVLHRTVPLAVHGPDPEHTDAVMLQRERISRIRYRQRFFDYPLSLGYDTVHKLGLRRMLHMGGGYLQAQFHQRSEQTLADFMINRFGEPLYETFFRDYTQKVWGRSPADIDADWGAQRIKTQLGKEHIPTPTWWNRERGLRNYYGRFEQDDGSDIYTWNLTTIKKILTQPAYIGAVANQKNVTKFKIGWMGYRPMDEWVIVEGMHEPIIDRQTWDIVQEKINSRKRPDGNGNFSIFSGLVHCADCGRQGVGKDDGR